MTSVGENLSVETHTPRPKSTTHNCTKERKAAKKMSANAKKSSKASRMFPGLHEEVAAAVSSHVSLTRFHQSKTGEKPNNIYSTFVMGHFNCYNPRCKSHSWSSGQITILIRGFPGFAYDAEVFGQRCRGCKRLGKLVMDKQSYVERVSYRVLIWAGVQLERPSYVAKATPPHEKELCEGCRRSICRWSGK